VSSARSAFISGCTRREQTGTLPEFSRAEPHVVFQRPDDVSTAVSREAVA
jgi:hypothetical protein